ncbi:Prolyl oligopeptidase family protein [Variovorax boronicumulans]|uniref:prolyl oligopeptidase family serine peptidase n=1 Tax=Variovorax boronicumulans TaxID=436515 RepID=UPI00209BD8F3|nr:prolyl oligopeptidase family serine peptidase [Variovorax boronicumulans]PBI84827.1 Prolyl oligopeptidase family protein [Variovorax boronicumulans]
MGVHPDLLALREREGRHALPAALFTTSTRDDRVGPVHARKMHAKLLAQGHDSSFYENMEGGHSAAADNKASAFMDALGYAYLWHHIGRPT